MMNCPNCKTKLNEQKMESKTPGTFIQVEQCPKCGGVWFDLYELHRLRPEETVKLGQIDKDKVAKPVEINNEITCPRDNTPLDHYNSPVIPRNVHVDHCSKCGGLWLNKGDIIEFQKKKFESNKLPNPNDGGDGGLVDFGNFLMTPLDTGSMPGTSSHPLANLHYDGPENPYLLGSVGANLIRSIPIEQRAQVYQRVVNEQISQNEKDKAQINFFINVIRAIFLLLQYLG